MAAGGDIGQLEICPLLMCFLHCMGFRRRYRAARDLPLPNVYSTLHGLQEEI
jgi:hypothetical protein